jgi:hypothetical protein
MKNQPFLFLIVAIALAVGLAVFLSRVPDLPRALEEEDVADLLLPTPTPPRVEQPDEEDFSTSRELSREEVIPLFTALSEKIDSYQTVQSRIRMRLFPDVGPTVETEVRIDAEKPDRAIRRVFASFPKDHRDPLSEWEMIPMDGTAYKDDFFRKIEYRSRGVFDSVLDATEEPLLSYHNLTRKERDKMMANPLADYLVKLPYPDRFKEIVRALEVKTSQGREIQVTFRVNSAMADLLTHPAMSLYFPGVPGYLKPCVYRKDVFKAESGELLRVEYLTLEEKVFVQVDYPQLTWNEPIPEDRFDLEVPDKFMHRDMNRVLAHKLTQNLDRREVQKKIDAGETDWPTIIRQANDY